MQELSLNVLDIAQNSISAKASLITISVDKQTAQNYMSITIEDNGVGMDKEKLSQVENPFFTTRTTRAVGLGIPFFKMSAEMTGGEFKISSEVGVGTTVMTKYVLDHIDLMPLGDMTSTMTALISLNPDIDFVYNYKFNENEFALDTREVKVLLEGFKINEVEVINFIKEFIDENSKQIENM